MLEALRAFTTRGRPIGETRPKTRFHEILSPDSDSTGSKTPRVKAKLKGRGGEEVKSPSLEEAARRALSWAQIMARGKKGKWRSGLRGGVARGGSRVRVPCRDLCLACTCLCL